MASKRLRNSIGIGVGIALLALFVLALRPQPVLVDLGTVERGPLAVTVDEEARTRVRNPYIVSAPVAGRLLRVEIDAGDVVIAGETTVARLLPAPPSALDSRSREQAEAAVSEAMAALALARADRKKAEADLDLAREQVHRMRALRAKNAVSSAALDQAERDARATAASADVASAAIAMREAELQSARARLISFGETIAGVVSSDHVIPIIAPVSGQVLRVMQESETTMNAGEPILELGDVGSDLEIIAELLSSDAVKVSIDDPVRISDWGGTYDLLGQVERIEPWGFTKFSALGVEEQRVNTIVRFTEAAERRRGLGHGYRVEVHIEVWRAADVLQIPTSALFRIDGQWAVYRNDNGTAISTPVSVGQNNGERVQILDGLQAGDNVILYPGEQLADGVAIAERP